MSLDKKDEAQKILDGKSSFQFWADPRVATLCEQVRGLAPGAAATQSGGVLPEYLESKM
jgi:hypothetical protein